MPTIAQCIVKITRVMECTGCSAQLARDVLVSEEWDVLDAVIDLKDMLGLKTVCIKLGA